MQVLTQPYAVKVFPRSRFLIQIEAAQDSNSAPWRGVVFLAAVCACAGAASSAEAGKDPGELAGSENTPGPEPGWLRMPQSLLYYDADGNLSSEIGLGRWEEASQARIQVKVIDAGTSPTTVSPGHSTNARSGTASRPRSWNPSGICASSRRIARNSGPKTEQLRLRQRAAGLFGRRQDLPACAAASGWLVRAGQDLSREHAVGSRPFPELEALQISPNGRYGLARWDDPDKSASHSFLD